MNIWNPNSDTFDLNCQIEELKGLLRSNDLLLKDQQFKHVKTVENYEIQITRLNDENRVLKEKYERIYEAQRKLEKLNSDLEDRLLKIVEKYENEQKSLLEDLTIAHSKLVEANLNIEQLEKEKDSYKNDCNLAVSLLQCKPNEFVSHSYRSLPSSIKDRLKTQLPVEEISKLELHEQELNTDQIVQKSNPKIPIFQPSAAAALMYTYQNDKNLMKKKIENECDYIGINLDVDSENGLVSTSLLAQVLKKESDEKAKKSLKLFPYVCLRCKKQTILCDSPSQTGEDFNNATEDDKIMIGKPRNILSNEAFLRSKSIGNRLVDFDSNVNNQKLNVKTNQSYHSKSASTDFGNFKNAFYI
ncbi:unnamed protein product [Brachionus calyciflorus]|uniref:Uncharacterized protein n=1 Tax=Brachionus calyciflorus TaxID=104777 RepID=A0A814KHK0_9BILA|nr:unnamed protein product [Brachionus calyciflorus]